MVLALGEYSFSVEALGDAQRLAASAAREREARDRQQVTSPSTSHVPHDQEEGRSTRPGRTPAPSRATAERLSRSAADIAAVCPLLGRVCVCVCVSWCVCV